MKVYANSMVNHPLFNYDYTKELTQSNPKEFKDKMNKVVAEMFKAEYLQYFDKEYFFGCSFDVYENIKTCLLNTKKYIMIAMK